MDEIYIQGDYSQAYASRDGIDLEDGQDYSDSYYLYDKNFLKNKKEQIKW